MSSSAPRKTSTTGISSQQNYAAAMSATNLNNNWNAQQQYHQAAQPQYPTNAYSKAPQPQQNEYQNGYTQTPQPQQRVLNVYPQGMAPRNVSNTVARRNENYSTALVPRNSNFGPQSTNQYASAENALVPAINVDPEQQFLLEAVAKAEKVAEEAQSDRPGAVKKSIPPFVQKLATFLNRGTDQELIRWSDKGDSFIVFDEDEFARSLIPQLFKHSNYASFVRQLNMYGFHKRVGLADNSMRSSESQQKAPSEYAHQYFRRGYDVLQWLISKPKKAEAKQQGEKRKAPGSKREDTYEIGSDDEYDNAQNKSGAMPGTIAKTEFNRLSAQLAEMQASQQHVLNLINGLRNSQTEIMRKALAIEMNNQRHDTSINSILSFLANVFRKSMEGRNPEFAEMLAGMLQQAQGAGMPNGSTIPTGTVQDLSDSPGQDNLDQQSQNVGERRIMSPVSRRQHLLPAIPAHQSRAGTPARPSGYQTPTVTQAPTQQTSRITEVYETSPEDTTSPMEYRNEPATSPEDALHLLIGANNPGTLHVAPQATPQATDNHAASIAREQRRRMMHSMPAPASASTPQQNNQEIPAHGAAQSNSRPNSQSQRLHELNNYQGNQTNQPNQTNMPFRSQSPVVNNMQMPQGSSPVANNTHSPQGLNSAAALNAVQQNAMQQNAMQQIQNQQQAMQQQQNDNNSALSNLVTNLPASEPSILDEVNQSGAQLEQLENFGQHLNNGFQNLNDGFQNLNGGYQNFNGNVPDLDNLVSSPNPFVNGPFVPMDSTASGQDFPPTDEKWLEDMLNQDPTLYAGLDSGAYDFDFSADNDDFDFGADPGGFLGADNAAPANGTTDTPSPAHTEEIVRDDLETDMPPAKRARAF